MFNQNQLIQNQTKCEPESHLKTLLMMEIMMMMLIADVDDDEKGLNDNKGLKALHPR